MKFKLILLTSLFIALSGCATTQKSFASKQGLTARDAIELSERDAPNRVPGIFSLSIKASGETSRYVYLNTESDYRDRRNVSVVLLPEFQKAFVQKYGKKAEVMLMDKNILVNSYAKRIKIYFYSNGERTEKYYFQTHIPVKSLKQVRFCETCT